MRNFTFSLATPLLFLFLLMTAQPTFGEISREPIGGPHGDNCVAYARTVARGMPHVDLTSYPAKLHIINSNKPKKRCVAIIEVKNGPFRKNGHVAVVTKVDDDGKKQSITLQEANFPRPGVYKTKVTGRKIKDIERELNIAGYWCP